MATVLRARRRALFSGVLVAATAMVALPAATAEAAAPARATGPVTKALTFTCEFPLIGAHQVTANVSAVFPGSVAAGSPIDVTDFSVGVSLEGDVLTALNLIGAATIEGTAAANVDVDYNGTELGVTLNGLAFPSTPVPETGPLAIAITGPIPGLTVKNSGTVAFAVGGAFTGQVTPRRADGSPTDLGTFPLPCGLDAGQDPALAVVTVS
ncbi:DUF6801 domain-containing protein [Amycolatopsis sp. lyj-112]|uniref:DUF6801 domain-containing protein n=1 Tax=Amycolatopsis sp. lyj-112 TaxID=2789288 RepID=UPI00397B019C